MNKPSRRKSIIIAGDVTIDWNIARVQRMDSPTNVWSADNLSHAFYQRGGDALLADLIEAVADASNQSKQTAIEVLKMSEPVGQIGPGDRRFHHAYALWAPFEVDSRTARDQKVWRVAEFLGIHRAGTEAEATGNEKNESGGGTPALIVLDDANLGFRDHPERWPKALSSRTARPWILLKIVPPLATGDLWNCLQRNHSERVVALITANDLRHHPEVHVSREISWERTAQDLVWELMYNPRISGLAAFAHTIISFDTAGAMLLSRKSGGTLEATLFFDPGTMEGEWCRHYPGGMIGYTSCLAAGIAWELVAGASKPDLHGGIQAGISAMRHLHIEGYGSAGTDLENKSVAFPISSIAKKIAERGSCLATVPVSSPAEKLSISIDGAAPEGSTRLWTILETQELGSLEHIAGKIVREGLELALSAVPVGRYGKLVTVDRKEIEALNCIGNLIREFYRQPQRTPLSIAVFGPPGSGKSFAVKQLADSVKPGEIDTLAFNISQLGGPEDLLDAFHQVRDKALLGKIPLVFWDEFDTTLDGQPLGWLRYFLAPMQDGEYQEGQIIHPIGKSIFVFAGSTGHNMEAFAAKLDEGEYQNKKLPDFISRLRGFLNILGPNCQGNNLAEDPYYIIRRAILLRSLLERHAPQLLHNSGGKKVMDIDDGVLRALLLTGEYKHGARSLEGIILTCQLSGKNCFERSNLPTEAQLNLHVDGREFYSLVHTLEPDEKLLEKLAEAAHGVFCDHLRAEGYKYGPETRAEDKVHSALRRYRDLPENEKEQNRNNVRDIPNKLAMAGYAMIPARRRTAVPKFTDDEVEILARKEHERWMREKFDLGWKYADKTVKARKKHKLLVPWDDLPPEEKKKDYVLVRGIPMILAKAGYTMVKLGQ